MSNEPNAARPKRPLVKRWWFWVAVGLAAILETGVFLVPSRAIGNVLLPDPASSLWRIINDKSLSYERLLRDSCQLLSKTLDGKPLAEVAQFVGRKPPNESGEYPAANAIYRRYLLRK